MVSECGNQGSEGNNGERLEAHEEMWGRLPGSMEVKRVRGGLHKGVGRVSLRRGSGRVVNQDPVVGPTKGKLAANRRVKR